MDPVDCKLCIVVSSTDLCEHPRLDHFHTVYLTSDKSQNKDRKVREG